MREYELAGIETIARGVAVVGGRLLLCRAKGAKTSYLPGGHIEFGETGREALVREIQEELGVACSTGRFLGVVENAFDQHGKSHAEINLVYELAFAGEVLTSILNDPRAQEDWIEFFWQPLGDLKSAQLLPGAFERLADGAQVTFAP